MKKSYFREHKIVGYSLLAVLLLEMIIVASMWIVNSIGKIGFYQYFISMLLCLVIGIPLLLFSGYLIGCTFIGFFRIIKQKSIKQNFKGNLIALLLFLVPFVLGCFFTYYGGRGMIASVSDIKYLNQPEKITFTDWRFEKQGGIVSSYLIGMNRFVGSRTYFIGIDENKKEYHFVIGKYPEELFEQQDYHVMTIKYLPNTGIIMSVD